MINRFSVPLDVAWYPFFFLFFLLLKLTRFSSLDFCHKIKLLWNEMHYHIHGTLHIHKFSTISILLIINTFLSLTVWLMFDDFSRHPLVVCLMRHKSPLSTAVLFTWLKAEQDFSRLHRTEECPRTSTKFLRRRRDWFLNWTLTRTAEYQCMDWASLTLPITNPVYKHY